MCWFEPRFLASNLEMLFQTYRPVPPLSDFIENFWLYDGYASPHLRECIFPSGTFELVFNLRDDELRIYKGEQANRCARLSGAIVSGPYSGFFVTDRAEETSVMGVHFKPGGAFPFLGLSAAEFADTHVDLEDIWGRHSGEIHDQLAVEQSPGRRFQILENALVSRMGKSLEHHPAVSLALDGFRHDTSRAVVRKMAQEAGLSNRRLIDVFNFEVGVKPKLFARIQRFQRVRRVAQRFPAVDWGQVSLEQGYFDQSHLIRDFLAFSGLTPEDYLLRLRALRKQGSHIKFNHLPLDQ